MMDAQPERRARTAPRRLVRAGLLLLMAGAPGLAAHAQEDAAQGQAPEQAAVSFSKDVLPILRAHCQACHQPAKSGGDVILLNHAQVIADLGTESEPKPLIIAGHPEKSLLIALITTPDDMAPEMPEKREPLSAEQVDVIRRWIAAGAEDDSTSEARPPAPEFYPRPPVVTSLDFAPDGALLAVSGRGEVLLHEIAENGAAKLVGRLGGLSERIETIAFSPDGKRLAVAGGSPGLQGEVQIWSIEDAQLQLSLVLTYDTLRGISWSQDGTRVAFGGKDNSLRIIDAISGEQLLYQGAHSDWVLDTTFSSDDSHIISVGRDRSMKLTLVATQQFIDNITSITPGALKGGLMSVQRHPTKDELLIGGADGLPKIYRMYREKKRVIGDDFNKIREFPLLEGRVFRAIWDPKGERVAIAGGLRDAGRVRAHNVADGKQLWQRDFPSSIYAADYDPTGGRLAVGGFEGLVWMLNSDDGSILSEFIPVPMGGDELSGIIEAGAGEDQ